MSSSSNGAPCDSANDQAGPNPNLEAALAHARAGWRVFPVYWIVEDGRCACEYEGRCARLRLQGSEKTKAEHAVCPIGGPCLVCHPGKHPRTMHGHNDATLSEELIRQWWALAPWNIGIAIPEGVVIVDIDPKNFGHETLEKICGAYGEAWAQSQWVDSGSGGLHIYFTCEPGRRFPRTLNEHFGPGIDLQQHGTYVLVPPSNHRSGGVYSNSKASVISPVPEWLLKLSEVRTAQAATRTAQAATRGGYVALTPIDKLPPPIVEVVQALGPWREHEGSKFYLCGALGGFMRKRGFTAAQCESTLRAWLPANEPGVNVAHGLSWAVNAWGLAAQNVSGFTALSDLLDTERTKRVAGAIEAASPLTQQVHEYLERRVVNGAPTVAAVAGPTQPPEKRKRKVSKWAERVVARVIESLILRERQQ